MCWLPLKLSHHQCSHADPHTSTLQPLYTQLLCAQLFKSSLHAGGGNIFSFIFMCPICLWNHTKENIGPKIRFYYLKVLMSCVMLCSSSLGPKSCTIMSNAFACHNIFFLWHLSQSNLLLLKFTYYMHSFISPECKPKGREFLLFSGISLVLTSICK